MIQSKCYPKHTHISIEINALNINDDMRNHLLSFDVLIVEDNFHDI